MCTRLILLLLVAIVAVAAGCDPLDPLNGLVEKQQPTQRFVSSSSTDESSHAKAEPTERPSSEKRPEANRNTEPKSNRSERGRQRENSSAEDRNDRRPRTQNEVAREIDVRQVDKEQANDDETPNQRTAKPRQNDDEEILFQLHTGTALPQTLPGGTALGVAVTYELSGSLNPSARYLLVVERSAGKPAELQFRPKQSDTIGGFIQGWQPSEAPFSCHIVEHASSGKRRRVSHDEFLR